MMKVAVHYEIKAFFLFKSNHILYATTIFLSAFLLFWIQPLMSFDITPIFGGTPNVWNTLLLFFQAVLLLAYFYAHLINRFFCAKHVAFIHGVGLLIVAVYLYRLDLTFDGADIYSPILSVVFYAGMMIGLPFFMLATTAPLLQYFYANNHQGKQPYWLYAVSNAGSLLALLAFPFLIQPIMDSDQQFWLWKAGFVCFSVLTIILIAQKARDEQSKIKHPIFNKAHVKTVLLWGMLAFIPSSLLHSVGMVISNDISSFPLLWVIPLALYLVTFIIAFKGNNKAPKKIWFWLSLVFLVPVAILPLWLSPVENLSLLIAHLALFFIMALGCHSLLYAHKPEAKNLTEFYLWVAIGGVLGGGFNVLVAPFLFDKIYEYPLSISLGLIIFSAFTIARVSLKGMVLRSIGLLVMVGVLFSAAGWKTTGNIRGNIYGFDLYSWVNEIKANVKIKRNYFGIIRVYTEQLSPELEYKSYYNGFVLHGYELYNTEENRFVLDETTYHYPIIENARKLGKPYASLGLGTGADLCYMKPGEQLDIYEINPDLIGWAQNPKVLRSLSICEGDYTIIEGDARQKLARVPDHYYGGIISTISASGSVPFHLITEEAFRLYLDKLAPGGALVFMTPANFFDFTPLFARYARVFDMPVYEYFRSNEEGYRFRYFLFLKPPLTINSLRNSDYYWQEIDTTKASDKAWTDSYYNIWSVLKK